MDEKTPFILERINCNVFLFSLNEPDNINKNFNYVYCKDEFIYINNRKFMSIREIPITMNGLASFNIENAMAATCALYALKVPENIIKEGLKTFLPNDKHNKGRLNIFEVNDFNVMLDYGHNVSGYEAVINTLKKLEFNKIIGVIGAPGDRQDKNIEKIGKLCANAFDRIIIKEDRDLRGRKPGEVASILYNGIISQNYPSENVIIELNEEKALKEALNMAEKNDLIVVFYEKFDPLYNIITEYSKEKVLVLK